MDTLTVLSYIFTSIYVLACIIIFYEVIKEIKSMNLLRKLREIKEYSKIGIDVVLKSGEIWNIKDFRIINSNVATKNTVFIGNKVEKMFLLKDIKELKDY